MCIYERSMSVYLHACKCMQVLLYVNNFCLYVFSYVYLIYLCMYAFMYACAYVCMYVCM